MKIDPFIAIPRTLIVMQPSPMAETVGSCLTFFLIFIFDRDRGGRRAHTEIRAARSAPITATGPDRAVNGAGVALAQENPRRR